MKRTGLLVIAAAMMICGNAWAQPGQRVNQDSLNRVTMADYENMKAQIGVKETKPRRDGQAEDPAMRPNYDELKANPFPFYPDPFTTFDGRRVTTPRMWYKVRRPELKEVFEREVYGRIPDNVPSVEWQVVREYDETLEGMDIVIRELRGVVDNSSFPDISVEIQAQVMWRKGSGANLPVVLDFSYMLGKPDDWGVLRAWGWGVSKMIDYFETDGRFDASKVAVEGVSRYGKAALVTMAFDDRVATAMVCSSGRGGAGGWRRDCGETLNNTCAWDSYHADLLPNTYKTTACVNRRP